MSNLFTERVLNMAAVTPQPEDYTGEDLSLIHISIEYADNRISLYAAQHGKCAVTGSIMEAHDIHCHHSIVGHQLHELSLIICRVFQLFHFFCEMCIRDSAPAR